MKKIAIIGAGLSDLSATHFLKDHAEITLFERARGVSGRISTWRAEPYFFDHGAQYFTARTKAFQDFIQPLINQVSVG
jgi:predicted NAD/FAD-dependent oxidoreductase